MVRATLIICRIVAWGGIAAFTAWVWRAVPAPESLLSGTGVTLVEATVGGQQGEAQTTLDIYLPPAELSPSWGKRGHPAVLAIHGGSWIGGSRVVYRFAPQDTVVRLAQHGLVVIATDYRLARPGSPSWPQVVGELRDVVRWVRRNAGALGVDSQRIVAMGQSAGGHLAAMLGTLPEEKSADGVSSQIQAVVAFYAPFDLDRLMKARRLEHEPVRLLLGAAAENPELVRQASPISHVTNDDPPMLLFHGSEDSWVLPDQSLSMAQALDRARVKHRLMMIDGARHGFEAMVKSPKEKDLMPEILAFLKNVWNAP